MASVANIIGVWEALQSADLSIDQERCVVVRNRNARCRHCAEICTTGCISVEAERIVIEASKCIGCGTCATVCPSGAIEAHYPDDDELFASAAAALRAAGGAVCLACECALEEHRDIYDLARVVGLVCLGRVDEDLLMRLADVGAEDIALVHGDCSTCPLACGARMAEAVVATANALFGTWARAAVVRLVDELPAFCACTREAYDAERRRVFIGIKQQLKGAARIAARANVEDALAPEGAASVAMVGVDGTLPHFVPPRRCDMLERLRAWPRPENALMETRLWGNVMVDVSCCESCRMCAVFCPTGALARAEEGAEGFFGLLHTPALCVRCETCESICPEGALEVSTEVFTDDIVDGLVESIALPKPSHQRMGPQSALHAMRDVLGCKNIYDR